jgi:hypothetical protein
MTRLSVRILAGAVVLALMALVMTWPSSTAKAAGPTLESHQITSEFPAGFRIKAQASGENEISSVAVRLRVGQLTSGTYNYLDFEKTGGSQNLVDGEFFWRTETVSNYIPPGTIIRYTFEIEDSAGQKLETETFDFVYFDARFVDDEGNSRWEEVSDGTVAVAYKGPVKKRAEEILRTIVETLDKMVPIMGEEAIAEPIRVTMYNNNKEMLEALPPKSAAISRELITEGQAFTEVGTLLVLGGGRLALGTASHEVMHIITHRVGDSVFRRVPSWLSEGLSEFANVDPGFSYDIALDFAIETDRLLPHVFMPGLPGESEDVIIFYGQSRSIVMMMIADFGPAKMKDFMASLQSGNNMDKALTEVYGLTTQTLDIAWRSAIGAKQLDLTARTQARPTAVPQRVPLLYSLTPQAQSEVVADAEDLATATPEPTATPEATAIPDATAVPTPAPEVAVAVPDADVEPTALASDSEPKQTGSGASCNPSASGAAGPLDVTTVGFLLGIIGLGLRKRF